MSLVNPSIGIVSTSSTVFLTSFATLVTNEYISKMKLRYTDFRDGNNITTPIFEMTLKTFMVDNKIDEKEALELKKIYNHYFDMRKRILKITSVKVEDFIVDILSIDSISEEQRTKLNNFLAKLL